MARGGDDGRLDEIGTINIYRLLIILWFFIDDQILCVFIIILALVIRAGFLTDFVFEILLDIRWK